MMYSEMEVPRYCSATAETAVLATVLAIPEPEEPPPPEALKVISNISVAAQAATISAIVRRKLSSILPSRSSHRSPISSKSPFMTSKNVSLKVSWRSLAVSVARSYICSDAFLWCLTTSCQPFTKAVSGFFIRSSSSRWRRRSITSSANAPFCSAFCILRSRS